MVGILFFKTGRLQSDLVWLTQCYVFPCIVSSRFGFVSSVQKESSDVTLANIELHNFLVEHTIYANIKMFIGVLDELRTLIKLKLRPSKQNST